MFNKHISPPSIELQISREKRLLLIMEFHTNKLTWGEKYKRELFLHLRFFILGYPIKLTFPFRFERDYSFGAKKQ